MKHKVIKCFEYFKNVIVSFFFIFLSSFVKRNKYWFAFGAWDGFLFADNSRYLLEKMTEIQNEHYRFFWVGSVDELEGIPTDKRIKILKKNSFEGMMKLIRCKYMFCSQHLYNDLCNYNVFKGAIVTYLHHGLPIKRWGNDAVGVKEKKDSLIYRIYQNVLPYKRNYQYFAVSSSTQADHFYTSLRDFGCAPEKILPYGTPRNDFLFNATVDFRTELKCHYARRYGFDHNKKLVLYLPTYRRKSGKTQSLLRTDVEERIKLLAVLEKHDAILIEKKHFVEDWRSDALFRTEENIERYIKVSQNANAQELLLISDILISDYSGAFVDFLIMDKPIIHYVYDYEEYRDQDSGLYYDISEFESGSVTYDFDQLVKAVDDNFTDPEMYKDIRKKRREFFLEYETGCASEQIVDRVVKNAGNQNRR